jgi:hypothetical protein
MMSDSAESAGVLSDEQHKEAVDRAITIITAFTLTQANDDDEERGEIEQVLLDALEEIDEMYFSATTLREQTVAASMMSHTLLAIVGMLDGVLPFVESEANIFDLLQELAYRNREG